MVRHRAVAVTHQHHISGYYRLTRRLSHTLSSPAIQAARQATFKRSEHDHPEDWERLIDELRSSEAVSVTHHDDARISIRWHHY